MIAICSCVALADITSEITLVTPEDIYANIGLYGNNVNVHIDGYDDKIEETREYSRELTSSSSMSETNIMKTVYEPFAYYDAQERGENGEKIFYDRPRNTITDPIQLELRDAFDEHFVPREVLVQVIEYQQKQIQQLIYEVEAIKKTIDEDEFCDAKLQVVKEYDLPHVSCGETTYYNHLPGNEFIILETMEITNESVIPQENTTLINETLDEVNQTKLSEATEEELRKLAETYDLDRLEYWMSLCDVGNVTYCILIEENYSFEEQAI